MKYLVIGNSKLDNFWEINNKNRQNIPQLFVCRPFVWSTCENPHHFKNTNNYIRPVSPFNILNFTRACAHWAHATILLAWHAETVIHTRTELRHQIPTTRTSCNFRPAPLQSARLMWFQCAQRWREFLRRNRAPREWVRCKMRQSLRLMWACWLSACGQNHMYVSYPIVLVEIVLRPLQNVVLRCVSCVVIASPTTWNMASFMRVFVIVWT